MKVERVEKISQKRFTEEYLLAKKPVIVTDAMNNWDLSKFSPDSLKANYGDQYVQVYNDLFDLKDISTLGEYLEKNFGEEKTAQSHEYIRWYTRLKDVDFYWSDETFISLKNEWGHPYFLPESSYAVPYFGDGESVAVNETNYPYKGLFISGRGAKTRLHRDPFNSNAVLCQFYGEKSIRLYSPDQAGYLMNDQEFVDIKNPDTVKFPLFNEAVCNYEDTLSAGEIVFFPAGWFHDVTSKSDSISITWNFVHSLELPDFYAYIKDRPEDDQLEIARFFLKDNISSEAGVKEITAFLKNKFQ